MDLNFNKLPSDLLLPEEFNGKKPIHVAQAVIGDGDTETSYKVLCTDGSYEIMPSSALQTEEQKAETAAKVKADKEAKAEEARIAKEKADAEAQASEAAAEEVQPATEVK
jgi:hypothetical protein